MSANDRQVGGEHYKSLYQHWSLVIDTDMGYFEGQITRYIARWRKKNGLQDLEKAEHYLQKLIENYNYLSKQRSLTLWPRGRVAEISVMVDDFCTKNSLPPLESAIFHRIAEWQMPADLEFARVGLQDLIIMNGPKPVPLEDSNKHADRSK